MPLFEVAILEHPKKAKKGADQDLEKLIFGPDMVVAHNDQAAAYAVLMDNAAKLKNIRPERMEVLIRPFG